MLKVIINSIDDKPIVEKFKHCELGILISGNYINKWFIKVIDKVVFLNGTNGITWVPLSSISTERCRELYKNESITLTQE